MNLMAVHSELNSEAKAAAFLEKLRWPNGVSCVTCGSDRICRVSTKGKTGKPRKIFQCLKCRLQFSATTGSMFHDTHLPLQKWFLAIALMTESRKGMSANQLKRALGVQYRTAWYMAHRIRKAMEDRSLPKLTGIVEVDETYVGGKPHRGEAQKKKQAVIGIRQRGGNLVFMKTPDTKMGTLYKAVEDHVDADVTTIMTDEGTAYNFELTKFRGKHVTINHSKEYVRDGGIHTNTVESAFSLLKRGIVGTFHQLSVKHLQRYLVEFSYRFNGRHMPDLFERTVERMTFVRGMRYAELIA